VYRPVPRGQIADTVAHLRELYREIKPSNERENRARERREIVTKNLLSNLFRTKEHPTLHAVLEVADIFSLTLDGAHRLFGYDLDRIREYDVRFNGGRTHIIESYPFERDLLVDLPSRLGSGEVFGSIATLHDLVPEWQSDIPIRALEEEGWRQPSAFYIHVGTEDSLGSSLPPGAVALVEPISDEEQRRPNPRVIYLLQFGNGYRCSRCVATRGKLLLLIPGGNYTGPQEFAYPGGARIVGRIRMFALDLPVPDYPLLRSLPSSRFNAPLILPWEHLSMDRMFAAKYYRFQRTRQDFPHIREALEAVFHSKLNGRTERRYRRPTSSQPHIDTLIQLTMINVARYTDSLRAGHSLPSDRERFSLETLLKTRRLKDLPVSFRRAQPPIPTENWTALRKELVEWPALLSTKFPQLRSLDDRVVRLPRGSAIKGFDPSISPGSVLLLERVPGTPDLRSEVRKTGWGRSIYALRRGAELFLGHLERDGNRYTLFSDPSESDSPITFRRDELPKLSRVASIVVPV
jgi:hypothetical protein